MSDTIARDRAMSIINAAADGPAGKQLTTNLRQWGVRNPHAVARDLIGSLLNDGLYIVPREPTEAMRIAGVRLIDTDEDLIEAWRAMVDEAGEAR